VLSSPEFLLLLSFFPSHDFVFLSLFLFIPPLSFSPFFPFLFSLSNCSKAAVIKIEILTTGNILLYCCVCSLVTGGHLGGTAASMCLKDEIVCSYESDQATGVMTQGLQSGPFVQPYSGLQLRQLLWKDQNSVLFCTDVK